MTNYVHLTFEDQLQKFIERKMSPPKESTKAIQAIKTLNYYKIKEIAKPFAKTINDDFEYSNISFDQIINRYYYDKQFRSNLFFAIETIEISFKTQFAYALGESFGAFGYLDLKNWFDTNKNKISEITNKHQPNFNKMLEKNLKECKNNIMIQHYLSTTDIQQIPVWIVMEIFTFGQIILLYEKMNKALKIKISNFYNCSPKELISWLLHLKLVRNICAHNGCIIDFAAATRPITKPEWLNTLTVAHGQITNRIALTILIVDTLMKNINERHKYFFMASLINAAKISSIQHFGFKDIKSAKSFMNNKNS